MAGSRRMLLALGLLLAVASCAHAQSTAVDTLLKSAEDGGLGSIEAPDVSLSGGGVVVKDSGIVFNADGSATIEVHGVPLFTLEGKGSPPVPPAPAPVPVITPAPGPKYPPVPIVPEPTPAPTPPNKATEVESIITAIPGAISGFSGFGRKLKL